MTCILKSFLEIVNVLGHQNEFTVRQAISIKKNSLHDGMLTLESRHECAYLFNL